MLVVDHIAEGDEYEDVRHQTKQGEELLFVEGQHLRQEDRHEDGEAEEDVGT